MKKIKLSVTASAVALALVLSFSFLYNLDGVPLHIWDEARNANNALLMFQRGNWLVPHYDDVPDMWNTKPPLLIWMQALLMKIVGINEWAVRLPSALAAMATGFVLWGFARRYLKNEWTGFLAGAVLATSFAYVYNHGGRTGDYDTLMILFTTSASLSLFLWVEEGQRKWLLFFWTALTMAVLTKGIAGLMLTPGLALFVVVRKRLLPLLTTATFYYGLAFFLFVVLGYYGLREQYNPGYLKAVSENELGGRYLQALEDHAHPFWFYWTSMKEWLFTYWKWFVFPAFLIVALLGSAERKKITLFHSIVILPFFLIISIAQTKLEWYVLPLYPFLALQIAILLSTFWEWLASLLKTHRAKRIGALLFFLIFFTRPYTRTAKEVLYANQGPVDHAPHYQSTYIHQSLRQHRSLNNYHFIYSDYSGQIGFYIRKLQHEGTNAALHHHTEGLQSGWKVVVSQEEIESALLKGYRVQKLEEKWGCKVYLVLSSL